MDLPRLRQTSLRILSDSSPARDLRSLNEFAVALLRPCGFDDLLWTVAERVGTVLGFEDCVIYLREGNTLVQRAAYGVKNPKGRKIENPITLRLGQGIVGTVAATGISRIVDDVRSAPDYIPDVFAGRSELTVPICYGGQVIGIIDSESSALADYREEDLELVEWIANIAAGRIAAGLAEQARESVEAELKAHRTRSAPGPAARVDPEEPDPAHLDALGRLVGNLSAELDNILTSIRGHISLVREETGSDPDTAAVLDAAVRECDRAGLLSSQFDALSERASIHVSRAVPIEGLLRGVAAQATRQTGRGVRVSFTAEDDILVDLDTGQIGGAFLHLLVRACEGTPPGDAVDVQIRRVDPGPGDLPPGVLVTIRDRGFEPHRIAPEEETRHSWSGLALTVARRVIARHGGALDRRTTLGPGAEFAVRLPLVQAPRHGRDLLPAAALRKSTSPVHILVMDDEPGIRDVLARWFARLGHRVETASCGEEALVLFQSQRDAGDPFGLAILDLSVPGRMGGQPTLRHLRALDPDLGAIVIGGFFPDVAELIGPGGFDTAVSKPFGLRTIQDAVEAVLGRRSGT